MGIMTFRAQAVFDGLVPTLALLHRFADIPVTHEAQRPLALDDHAGDVACVRIMTGKTHPAAEGHMIKSRALLRHQVSVALSAELGGCLLEEPLLIRAVSAMARSAFPVEHRPMRVCLDEFRLGFHVAGITDETYLVFQNVFLRRPVRVMARGAHPLGKRHMTYLEVLVLRGVGMALETQLLFRPVDQILVFGRVRLVARNTARAAGNRRVLEFSRVFLVRVAAQTEVNAGVGKQ
jgi:hypothetical protein